MRPLMKRREATEMETLYKRMGGEMYGKRALSAICEEQDKIVALMKEDLRELEERIGGVAGSAAERDEIMKTVFEFIGLYREVVALEDAARRIMIEWDYEPVSHPLL